MRDERQLLQCTLHETDGPARKSRVWYVLYPYNLHGGREELWDDSRRRLRGPAQLRRLHATSDLRRRRNAQCVWLHAQLREQDLRR